MRVGEQVVNTILESGYTGFINTQAKHPRNSACEVSGTEPREAEGQYVVVQARK